MSLTKAIAHGKEFRKLYRKSKAVDRTCRNGRSYLRKCPHCDSDRFIQDARLEARARVDELDLLETIMACDEARWEILDE